MMTEGWQDAQVHSAHCQIIKKWHRIFNLNNSVAIYPLVSADILFSWEIYDLDAFSRW